MAKKLSRKEQRERAHLRKRSSVLGSAERPRLCVFRSAKHTYAQIVDDQEGKTLVGVSSLKVDGKKLKNGGNIEAAKKVGQEVARRAKEQGIENVVFDRNGFRYGGRVRAVADSAREAGLKF